MNIRPGPGTLFGLELHLPGRDSFRLSIISPLLFASCPVRYVLAMMPLHQLWDFKHFPMPVAIEYSLLFVHNKRYDNRNSYFSLSVSLVPGNMLSSMPYDLLDTPNIHSMVFRYYCPYCIHRKASAQKGKWLAKGHLARTGNAGPSAITPLCF